MRQILARLAVGSRSGTARPALAQSATLEGQPEDASAPPPGVSSQPPRFREYKSYSHQEEGDSLEI